MYIEFYNYPPSKYVSPFDAIEADNYFVVAGKITIAIDEINSWTKIVFETNNIFTILGL